MKLVKFTATNVFDYLNINLDFNKGLSIITGGNGSGKTTAIKLMQAILAPDFQELINIPYLNLSLTFERTINSSKETTTVFVNKKDGFEIVINNLKPFVLDENTLKEIQYLSLDERKEYNDHFFRFGNDSLIYKFLLDLPTPIFIGLERRNEDIFSDRDLNTMERRRRTMMIKERHHDLMNKGYKGTLGLSLLETEFLIQDLYKRLRAIEDSLSTKLQKELIKTSFDFKDLNFNELTSFNYEEQKKILERKEEIRNALRKVTNDDREIDTKLCRLFEKLESILSKRTENNNIELELLINLTQINRLTNIVGVIDEHNSKVANSFKPINNYLNIVNSFFIDTGKSISVDEVGHLVVKRPGIAKPTSIEALSSGERHIVILFANAMFNKMRNSPNNILIIDEPELSLHIRWQDKFIDSLLSVTDKRTQLILATHSPDIVGDYKGECISIK